MARRAVSAKELAYYRANFREAIREDGVVCLECGALLHFLGRHVTRHGLTPDEYREKWGYNRGQGLVSQRLHETMRQQAFATGLGERGKEILDPQRALEARQALRPLPRAQGTLNRVELVRARYAAGWRTASRVSDDMLRALVADGLTIKEIATRTGLQYESVRHRIRALGLVSPTITPCQIRVSDADLLALRQAGLGSREIAGRIGLTTNAVDVRLRKLRRRGVPVPEPPGPRPNPRRRVSDEQLLGLAREGLRPVDIAARVGLAPVSVQGRLRRLRKRGLLPPSPRPRRRTKRHQDTGPLPPDG